MELKLSVKWSRFHALVKNQLSFSELSNLPPFKNLQLINRCHLNSIALEKVFTLLLNIEFLDP